MIGGIIGELTGANKHARIKGTVVLMRKNVLDLNDFGATIIDGISEFLGKGVTCQLISSTLVDPNNGNRGRVGAEANLEQWLTSLPSLTTGESKFGVTFDWEVEKLGVPGAVIVKNYHNAEFLLKTITLDDVPGRGTVTFVANSWVYPVAKYRYNRVFFANDTYLPSQMPAALKPYRDDELRNLRGDDQQGPYQEHDRVYRYDVYNDLGEPDRGNPRPVLGGSADHPYPRRCRTGRKHTKTDPSSESRLSLLEQIYVPRDERFGHLKMSDFLGYSIKAITQGIVPAVRTYVDTTPGEFDSFQDIINLYEGGLKLPNIPALEEMRRLFPLQLVKDLLPAGGDYLLKLPIPQIIKEDKDAWRTDEEFAREVLAGVNPMMITRLTEFPPKSTLDPSKYGDQTSTITAGHIEKNLEGLTVQQALDGNRLYILDHHDRFMPFLIDVNNLEGNFIYATRTLFFLRGDGSLAPLAIELSEPHIQGGLTTAKSKVYTPSSSGIEAWVWQLAKAYVAVNDSGWHQLISHWLNTHAVMEPFVIATNRQLSVTHPVHKLLHPHYRDTMTINALARQTLINGGGIFEMTVFPAKYALGMSSVVYKSWNFTEQGLPADLIKRGVAVADPSSPYKVRLLIEDYPYASDGLAIWHAIEQWVSEYLAIYYPSDAVLQGDAELQEWWKEVREVGHGDLKDAPWWPKMQAVSELASACTTIIWIASALHAAVNFGQYPYAGYLPNRPTVSRRPMPEPGTEAYAELGRDPELAFIHTITSQIQTIIGISLLEVLSKHSSDEVYLGQRDTPHWTSDARALEAFKRFSDRLVEIEGKVVGANRDPQLKNRNGPAEFPYMLLYPNTSDHKGAAAGLTAKGIPNSISI
ncbi:putative linoleate 9S-lipoxygenase 3 [Phragmites australis]|uniref:putative linoleate 9S-lipoxygenase 3 n=1 Tax=Phragmites australis TaxID=29695 RepID=UPI002D77AC2E|nr:putative linoleate 9S-lipoxygenase 3 [Phragmites australis]